MVAGLAAELSIASCGGIDASDKLTGWGMQDLINPETLSHCRRRVYSGAG